MGNKIVTLVTTFITMLAFVLIVSFISSTVQIDETNKLINEFTDTVRYNGYITLDQYSSLINEIPYKNVKLNITHFYTDSDTDITSAEYTNKGKDMRFTSQILTGGAAVDEPALPGYQLYSLSDGGKILSGSLLYDSESAGGNKADSHIYKMQVGDEIQVDLICLEDTFFDTIVSLISGSGTSGMKIIASASGVILNEKYF